MRYKINLMSKIRLFCNESLEEKKEINIDGDNYHYLANVMRCEVGSVVFLFNENDGEFLAKVSSKLKKVLKLIIYERKEYEKIDNDFGIIFCPPKSHKLDILVQKCTEIGVKNFVPVISERTENRNLNINRMQKIILEAVEQSNQIHVPNICGPVNFTKFIDQFNSENNEVFFADIQSDVSISDLKIDNTKSKFILIGPEGDFSPNELRILRDSFQSFTIGKRILRSETAAISSLVLFNNLKVIN
tara:strand:+ start:1552 stop:2286 length:735 start_codon:yes stop_codon:yes gene_type:complete